MQCLLLALGGLSENTDQCPLSGVKRTSRRHAAMSAFDPKQTPGAHSIAAFFKKIEPPDVGSRRLNVHATLEVALVSVSTRECKHYASLLRVTL